MLSCEKNVVKDFERCEVKGKKWKDIHREERTRAERRAEERREGNKGRKEK